MRRIDRIIGLSLTFLVASLCGGTAFATGLPTTPLPKFSDGTTSVEVMAVAGIIDRGRMETVIMCTSLASGAIHIGVQAFDQNGTLLNNVTTGAGAVLGVTVGQTVTFATSATASYLETQILPINTDVEQGSARVVASNASVQCAVVLVDEIETPSPSLAGLSSGVRPLVGTSLPGAPLPTFSDGKPATHSALIPGVIKRGRVETGIICTSLGTQPIHVGVQVFEPNGSAVNDVSTGNGAVLNVASGRTTTFGTTGTAALLETAVIVIPGVAQGVARVVTTSQAVMCTALVLDSALSPPESMSSLPTLGCQHDPVPTACQSIGAPNPPLPTFSDGKSSIEILNVPGVVKRDRMQTELVCTSLASNPIDIGVQVFNEQGTLLNDVSAGVGAILAVGPRATVTFGTTGSAAYLETQVISIPGVSQGSARVVASTAEVACVVMMLDDAVTPPVSLATLPRGVRPVLGSSFPGVPLPTFGNGAPATHSLSVGGVVKRDRNETTIFCTSLASTPIDIGVQVFGPDGVLQNDVSTGNGAILSVAPHRTVTFGTSGTAAFAEDNIITLTGVAQGSARIVSTSPAVMCSALVLDEAVTPPLSMSSLPLLGCRDAPLPTACAVCGDGNLESGEPCDDGNTENGDCCSSSCQFEPSSPASCDGNACTRPDTCSNGVCVPGGCADGAACTICGGTCDDTGSSCVCLP